MANDTELLLICRIGARLCGLPVSSIDETMRPLPIEALPDAPAFVLGMSVLRGRAIPVIDASAVVGGSAGRPSRFVVIRVGLRSVALAVDAVVGLRSVPQQSFQELPRILGLENSQAVTALGVLDNELMLMLGGIRGIPDSIWAQIELKGTQ